jgi:hypothetical protein
VYILLKDTRQTRLGKRGDSNDAVYRLLSGVLPDELLINIENLNFELTSNHIYIEGETFRVFKSLVSLNIYI